MPAADLFSREEALGGLPARRARTLLFLIESRAGRLAGQDQRAMDRYCTEETAAAQELACLTAFAEGREPPHEPTIQDLERYAEFWAPLVPENPAVRAALAHFLAQKYRLRAAAAPGIRAALGLDTEPVQRAYHRQYGKPLETIYAPRLSPLDRLRWAWAGFAGWVDALPPFWTAFALTLTETVGAGVLALPIALAGVGPLPGIALLAVFGLVNVLTVWYMAEAISRSGAMRYGSAFIGRAVADYLGGAGSAILMGGLVLICGIALLAYYIGFATTLANVTGLPAALWVALLFLVGLYFLRRESLSATVASALVVGFVNIGLLLLLSLVAFLYVQPTNLLYVSVPFLGGRPFDPAILELVFGTVLFAYFGHLSVSNCARVVMRRDPSGRSLIWGAAAAQVVAMILYGVWVAAANGAVAPPVLAAQPGTALVPLAERAGPLVHVFGLVFVILGMGMASIHSSLGLFNLTKERLPGPASPVVVLPRRHGRLVLRERGRADSGLRIGLVYLGLADGQPRFRLDAQTGQETRHLEMTGAGPWDARPLLKQAPGLRLTVETLDATPESARLRVASSLALAYEGQWDTVGLDMGDLLTLPDDERRLLTWITRQGSVGSADLAAYEGAAGRAVPELLETLLEQGCVQEVETAGEPRYQARLAHKRGSRLPAAIWQALGQDAVAPAGGQEQPAGLRGLFYRVRQALLGPRGRFWLAVSPVALIFLFTEWLLLINAASFTGPISFLGVIVLPLLGGVFPVLLLVASRRKGERVPAVFYRFLGNRLLVACIYLLFMTALFAYGLVIWTEPAPRVLALAVGSIMAGATIVMWRRGAFAPRLVVELRQEGADGPAGFIVVANGQPLPSDVRLSYPAGEQQVHAAQGAVPDLAALRAMSIQMPAQPAHELKVWAHQVTSEDDSHSLPATVDVQCGDQSTRRDLRLSGGQVIVPVSEAECRVELRLTESA